MVTHTNKKNNSYSFKSKIKDCGKGLHSHLRRIGLQSRPCTGHNHDNGKTVHFIQSTILVHVFEKLQHNIIFSSKRVTDSTIYLIILEVNVAVYRVYYTILSRLGLYTLIYLYMYTSVVIRTSFHCATSLFINVHR